MPDKNQTLTAWVLDQTGGALTADLAKSIVDHIAAQTREEFDHCVPLSTDGKAVYMDGFGEIPLDYTCGGLTPSASSPDFGVDRLQIEMDLWPSLRLDGYDVALHDCIGLAQRTLTLAARNDAEAKAERARESASGLAPSDVDRKQEWTRQHSLNYPALAARIINEERVRAEARQGPARNRCAEWGEYLAKGADHLLAAIHDDSEARLAKDEADTDSEEELATFSKRADQAAEALSEAMRSVRGGVYEFRKRGAKDTASLLI